MIRLLVLGFAAIEATAQVWINSGADLSNMAPNFYSTINQNTLTNTTLQFASDNSSIYSNSLFSFNGSTNTKIGTSGSTGNSCPAGTSTWPPDVHPQLWWDSLRNRLWFYGGVCNGVDPQQTYFFQVDNPFTNTVWTQKNPSHHPDFFGIAAECATDTTNDVFVCVGTNIGSFVKTWVYCDTSLNGGTLTSNQTTAGCIQTSGVDDWADVTTGSQPPGAGPGQLVYDPANLRVLQFGGQAQNQTWAYNTLTKSWANRNPTGGPPPAPETVFNGYVAIALNTNDGCMYYHYSSGVSDDSTNRDWRYCYAANVWTDLGYHGGPVFSPTMTWDAPNNRFIAASKNLGSGLSEYWFMTLPPGGNSFGGNVSVGGNFSAR